MKYVILFRGINVGDKNIVKMDALKQLLQELGISKVKTYIQSGNVVVDSPLEEKALQELLHSAFVNHFGFESHVVIRSSDEIAAILHKLPITEEELTAAEAADSQVEHLYVYFWDYEPEQERIDAICKAYDGPDLFRKGDREAYFLCHHSIRDSKLAIRVSKEFEAATTRNWKTVNKLYEMLSIL